MVLRIALVDEQVELFGLGDEAFLVECQRLQVVSYVFVKFCEHCAVILMFHAISKCMDRTSSKPRNTYLKHSWCVSSRSFTDDDLDLYWQPIKLRHGGFIPLGEARLLDHPALESSQSAKDLATFDNFDKHSGIIIFYSIHRLDKFIFAAVLGITVGVIYIYILYIIILSCLLYICIYIWPSVWWPPLPPEMVMVPICRCKLHIYIYKYIYICTYARRVGGGGVTPQTTWGEGVGREHETWDYIYIYVYIYIHV